MIPYDDLVGALAAWRARQGLPVVQVAGAAAARPAPAAKPAPAARPAPPPGPRSAPPGAPPRGTPPPVQVVSEDVDHDPLVEDSTYDTGGEDYVLSLGGDVIVEQAETTAIGGAPEPTEGVLVPKRGKRNPSW